MGDNSGATRSMMQTADERIGDLSTSDPSPDLPITRKLPESQTVRRPKSPSDYEYAYHRQQGQLLN